MLWISVCICFASAGYHYYLNRYRWMNVGCIASFIWGAVLLVNAISPFGWYPFSVKGESYMIIGTTALCVGLLQSRSNISMINYREDDITVVSGVDRESFSRDFLLYS